MFYLLSRVFGENQILWIMRGLLVLMVAQLVSDRLHLELLKFVLEKFVLGTAVALAVIFQAELRRFLELLGQGRFLELLRRRSSSPPAPMPLTKLSMRSRNCPKIGLAPSW
ncbi:hypothetical protein NON20_06990 [Synechocystis sp. B12]|nr:hypothetical protein NON20_06990 [Synechocystis sp. B12]